MSKDSNDKKNLSLKVAEAEQRDVGRKIARIDPNLASELQLYSGDVIEISSILNKITVLNWPAREVDRGKGLIRIDGYIRNRLEVGINDIVDIKKVESKDAQSITLAPTEPLRIVGAEGYLGEYLLGNLVSTGD
ncbi:MAG: AAA family ATPase, partial [Nitrososphaeraceae archaeon]|nr:AAA family ATPase [Nitrososphaeraceae archaeon]